MDYSGEGEIRLGNLLQLSTGHALLWLKALHESYTVDCV